jgi:hypothetical protein
VIPIDVLPDDVLLLIFDFHVVDQGLFGPTKKRKRTVEAWQALVHVCRRWRSVVFGSPRRLNLRLFFGSGTPGDMLDVWPALPLLISGNVIQDDADNIVAALERSDRVVEITLNIHEGSELDKIFAALHVPFPELTSLGISCWYGKMGTVPPDSFLGGSAPRLQSFDLHRIPLPGFLKPLLSTTHLIDLRLTDIPHSAYISPEAMVTTLSALTNLERLSLRFQSPQSRPDRESRRPPPPTRFVLPVLTFLDFKGDNGYIDDLVACIDAPRLNDLDVTFFNDIVLDTPQFIQFISRTPGLKALAKAYVIICGDLGNSASVCLSSTTSGNGRLKVTVRCKEVNWWQVSSMEQVCTLCLPPLPTLEDLYVVEHRDMSDWQDNIENALWLELLHPFTTVKNLYLSKGLAPHIVPAMQELVGGRATEVLPTLQNIFLGELQPSEPVREGIEKFVAARQGSITVGNWDGY